MAKSIEMMIDDLTKKVDQQYKDVDLRLDNIEKVLIMQEFNLKDHMKRSDNLESLVEHIREEDLKPVQKHVIMIEGIFKFLGALSLVLTVLTGIAKLFHLV